MILTIGTLTQVRDRQAERKKQAGLREHGVGLEEVIDIEQDERNSNGCGNLNLETLL